MFFTREDILKIQNALLQLSVKDSELPSAEPVTYDDTLSIIQDGKNKQIKIEDFFNQISLWKREDFINITDKYDEHYISLIEAINLVPVLQRKDGLVITFQDVEGNWEIYQFRGNITEFFEEDKWFNLYDYRNYIVQSIVPDEEDLTASIPDENGNSLVHLKDRIYDPTNFSGKGYKILRKNIQSVNIASTKITITKTPSTDGTLSFTINGKETQVVISATTDNTTALVAQKVVSALQESMTEYDVSIDASLIILKRKSSGSVTPSTFSASTTGIVCTITDNTKREFRNILTSDMINKPNTIYEIRYDFDLNNQDIKLAKGSEIKYTGGSIKNGNILYNDNTIIITSNSNINNFKNLQEYIIKDINFNDYVIDADIITYNNNKYINVNPVIERIRKSFYNKYQLLNVNIPICSHNLILAITGPIDLKNMYLDFNMAFVHIIKTKPTDTIFFWGTKNNTSDDIQCRGGVRNVLQIQQYSDIDKVFDLTISDGSLGIKNFKWISLGGHANYGLFQLFGNEYYSYKDLRYLHNVCISIKRYENFPNKDIIPYNILCLGDAGKISQCCFDEGLCIFASGMITIDNCINTPLMLAYTTVNIISTYSEFSNQIKIINSVVNISGGDFMANSRAYYEKYKGDYIRIDVQEDIDNFTNIIYPLLKTNNSFPFPATRPSYVDFNNTRIISSNWYYLNSYAGFLIHKENYAKLINLPLTVPINNTFLKPITYCNIESLFFVLNSNIVKIDNIDPTFAGINYSNTNMTLLKIYIEFDKDRKIYYDCNLSALTKQLKDGVYPYYKLIISNRNNSKSIKNCFNVLPLVFIFNINDEIFYTKYYLDSNDYRINKVADIIISLFKTQYKDYKYVASPNSFLEKDDGFYKNLMDNNNYNSVLCYSSSYNLDSITPKNDIYYKNSTFNIVASTQNISYLQSISSLTNGDIIYESSTNINYKVINGTLHNITQISGNTSSRPTKGLYSGFTYYDIDLNKNIVWNGSIWTNADGTSLNINKSGTTTERPTNVNIGFIYKDTTLNKLIIWEGSKWVNLDGTEIS